MLHRFTLSNGIEVVGYDMPSVRSFHLGISVKGGSFGDSDKTNGVAHFMEHILVQGIPSYPTSEELSQFIESLAGAYNAYTSQLLVSFSITVPFAYGKEAMNIASEVFFSPLFNESDIERERTVVLNEIQQDLDSQQRKFGDFFRSVRFAKGSNLRRSTVGDLDVVKNVTKEDLVAYWKEYFFPKNCYLLVIGNFEKLDIRRELEEVFGTIPGKKVFKGFGFHSNSDFSKRSVAIRKDSEAQINYIDLTYPSLSMDDSLSDRMKEHIANVILGGLSSSRLFRLLRHKRGLVYGVSSQSTYYPHLGYAGVSSAVTTENLDEVVSLIAGELAAFVVKGPSREELLFAQNYLANAALMSFDHPNAIAKWIEGELLWSDEKKLLLPEDYIKLLNNITVKDICVLLQKRWDFSRLNLVIQGSLEDTKINRDKYTSLLRAL